MAGYFSGIFYLFVLNTEPHRVALIGLELFFFYLLLVIIGEDLGISKSTLEKKLVAG